MTTNQDSRFSSPSRSILAVSQQTLHSPLISLFLLPSEQKHKHEKNKSGHDHHRATPNPPFPHALLHIVRISRQNKPRELVVLERPNAHLRVLVDERHSLSLIEESELVHSVHIRYMNDLVIIISPPPSTVE